MSPDLRHASTDWSFQQCRSHPHRPRLVFNVLARVCEAASLQMTVYRRDVVAPPDRDSQRMLSQPVKVASIVR